MSLRLRASAVKEDMIALHNSVRRLLALLYNTNAKDKEGSTALHRAAESCRGKDVRWLVARGADLEAMDAKGETPLQRAVAKGHRTIAEFLITKGAKPDIFAGILTNRIEVVVRALQSDPSSISRADEKGCTPLHRAARSGSREICELLVKAGADVNATDAAGSTPLHEAARCGQAAAADLLLDKNANPNAQNNNDETPLYLAAQKGHEDLLTTLLAAGANVNIKCRMRDTPLLAAARLQRPEAVNILLQKGADVNATDEKILEVADPSVVDLLIRHGATPASPSEIDDRLRPGRWSNGGFLGPHESLENVVAQDAGTLKRLGFSYDQIATALNEVIGEHVHRDFLDVDTVVFCGSQSCPWGCRQSGSVGFVIRNRRTGETIESGDLIVHLIRQHQFFEGVESPYRVDPEKLVRVLELVSSGLRG